MLGRIWVGRMNVYPILLRQNHEYLARSEIIMSIFLDPDDVAVK